MPGIGAVALGVGSGTLGFAVGGDATTGEVVGCRQSSGAAPTTPSASATDAATAAPVRMPGLASGNRSAAARRARSRTTSPRKADGIVPSNPITRRHMPDSRVPNA
jgi:hypothetical protein